MSSATPEPVQRRLPNGHGFGATAPPKSLPFPSTSANLTAVELLTFLPNCIKCTDVVYRFASNGGTRAVFWTIVNAQRDLGVVWHANSCGVMIYAAMRNAGYTKWTVKIHNKWHDAEKQAAWDETRLDVSNFTVPGQAFEGGLPIKAIQFKDLALDVRKMPEGNDALDLTRMVQYCVQNPEEDWVYPKDYEELLDLIGGPAQVKEGHFDRAAFKRWEGVKAPPPRPRSEKPQVEAIEAATEVRKRKKTWDTRDTPKTQMKTRMGNMRQDTPARGGTSTRENTPAPLERRTRARTRRRKRATDNEVAGEMTGIEDSAEENKEYTRPAATYIEPPNDTADPSDEAIHTIFLAEGLPGETDPFSAYAFGTHRTSPPYRALHRIAQPETWDVSGWAENLRWGFEQRACFSFSWRTEGWNESPEHMQRIAQIRIQQDWASDALIEGLCEVMEVGEVDGEYEL